MLLAVNIRHIEDIDSRALTYAEVKAIASGNPLVIEKASVDAEITRLTRLRSQHGEAQYRIRSQARHFKEQIPLYTQRIENLKLDKPAPCFRICKRCARATGRRNSSNAVSALEFKACHCTPTVTPGRKTTAGNIGVSGGDVKSFVVPIPPLTEQRRIVAELDALQAEVDALKRLQAETATELNALLPSVLDRAFKGEL
jgi:hypothetical protein